MTSKYLSRQYDPIIPEVIGICEEFNRERFSIQWLSDIIRETPEQIKQYVDIKVRNLIHDMNIPEPSDEIKMHVEPGTSTVFRKITSDGYVM